MPVVNNLVVEMENIDVRFPGVLANDDVTFTLQQGEIHALLGENGAGKSTLMNVLAGLYQPTQGRIKINGQVTQFSSPKDAIAAGIGMVHQHFMLVPTQTVTENILLGLDTPRFFLNLPKYEAEVEALQAKLGLQVDPRAKIWQLSVGEQQRVEILKTLYRGANILIMDEPTAVLAPQEIEGLMDTLQKMTEQGKSIIFISHKLHEVSAVANRVTVLRKGKVTAAGIPAAGLDSGQLAKLMVGREVMFNISKSPVKVGDIVLSLENVTAQNNKGLPALKGVSFTIRAGEILGVAGVAGNGQSELAEVISGLRACRGSIKIAGQEIGNQPPIRAIRQGVSHIPEDRAKVGSAPNLSLTDNLIMKNYTHQPLGNGWTINFNRAHTFAKKLQETYDISAPNVTTLARKLSGGNLQKVILAREISAQPNLLIAVQPTRGLDVGAIETIQTLLLAQRQAGAAILLISEELDELFTLSDRLVVIAGGHLKAIIPTNEADIQQIGLLMTGQGC